jgi:hypothetical protein
VGSYFSNGDTYDEGAERILAGPAFNPGLAAFFKGKDIEADDAGQGGIQLLLHPGGGVDLGFHFINYHDKGPQLYMFPGQNANPTIGKIGEYAWVFPENIQAYAMSASYTYGITNFALELGVRTNMPLVSSGQVVLPGTKADNDDNSLYAEGNTLHVNFNWMSSIEPNFLAKESSFMGEIAYNHLIHITKNAHALAPETDRDAIGIRMVFEPTYRQVFTGLDLSFPVGIGYFPLAKSSVISSFGQQDGGDASIGVSASYLDVWRFSLTYTHFYGQTGQYVDDNSRLTFDQSLADRDYIAFSLRRTF